MYEATSNQGMSLESYYYYYHRMLLLLGHVILSLHCVTSQKEPLFKARMVGNTRGNDWILCLTVELHYPPFCFVYFSMFQKPS